MNISFFSDEKIETGIALSVTGAPIGLALIMYFVAKPASLTISSPKNSPNRLAVVIDVDF